MVDDGFHRDPLADLGPDGSWGGPCDRGGDCGCTDCGCADNDGCGCGGSSGGWDPDVDVVDADLIGASSATDDLEGFGPAVRGGLEVELSDGFGPWMAGGAGWFDASDPTSWTPSMLVSPVADDRGVVDEQDQSDADATNDAIDDLPEGPGSSPSGDDCPKGSDYLCGPLPAPGPARSAWVRDPDVRGSITTEGSDWTASEYELVEQAIALLRDNQDLASWAMCKARGDDDSFGCISRTLEGSRPWALVRTHDPCRYPPIVGSRYNALTFPWGLETWLCGAWDAQLVRGATMFASGEDDNRDCAIVAMAGTLLHELTHLCGFAFGDPPCNCEVSYLASNYFKWAASKRFVAAERAPCCQPASDGTGTRAALPDPVLNDMSCAFATWRPQDCLGSGDVDVLGAPRGAGWAGAAPPDVIPDQVAVGDHPTSPVDPQEVDPDHPHSAYKDLDDATTLDDDRRVQFAGESPDVEIASQGGLS